MAVFIMVLTGDPANNIKEVDKKIEVINIFVNYSNYDASVYVEVLSVYQKDEVKIIYYSNLNFYSFGTFPVAVF